MVARSPWVHEDLFNKNIYAKEGIVTMKKSLCKMMETGYYILCFSTLMQMVCYAYIDPSVTTYAIQAIAGGAIAVGAVIGIYWRKARRKLENRLGIDESKKKETEDDVVEIGNDK